MIKISYIIRHQNSSPHCFFVKDLQFPTSAAGNTKEVEVPLQNPQKLFSWFKRIHENQKQPCRGKSNFCHLLQFQTSPINSRYLLRHFHSRGRGSKVAAIYELSTLKSCLNQAISNSTNPALVIGKSSQIKQRLKLFVYVLYIYSMWQRCQWRQSLSFTSRGDECDHNQFPPKCSGDCGASLGSLLPQTPQAGGSCAQGRALTPGTFYSSSCSPILVLITQRD